MPELQTGFDCTLCHHHHPTLPLSFSLKAPDSATRIPAQDQAQRVLINPDQCVLDGTRFYLRGRILLPILDHPQDPFIYGLWAEVSPKDFLRTQQLWTRQGRESAPPYPGYLDTSLPHYPRTTNLQVEIRTQPVGRRPHFHLLDPAHPLTHEQRHGITLARVQQIAETLLHP